jgi:CheY-like chemotaxis protein
LAGAMTAGAKLDAASPSMSQWISRGSTADHGRGERRGRSLWPIHCSIDPVLSATWTTWTVAVVDDDPTFCVLIRMALGISTKWRVIATTSAADARRLLESATVDILLVDERMPGERGTELVSALAIEGRLGATIPILLTADRFVKIQHGIVAKIQKPFDALKLGEQIARIVRDHRSAAVG